MLHLLADIAASQPPFNYSLWLPKSYYPVIRGIEVFAGALLIGALLLFLFRRSINKLKLRAPLVLGIFTIALYLGIFSFRPMRYGAPNDPIVWWINRAAAALALLTVLGLLDRLLLVPLLTRGGKIPLTRFVHQIINIVIGVFTLICFGSAAFGWDIDKFLAGSAVVSIVLGLALQETLGNFFSGLVMQASPPFAIGDWIVCGPHEGRVADMTWRAVTLHTEDDNFILIPNATVAKAEIVNFHAPSIATARKISVGLDYNIPPHDALAVLQHAASETPGVQPSPPPEARLLAFADSAITYEVKFWIADPKRHDDIEHSVRVSLWYRLREKSYAIPFPIRTVEHISLDQKIRREEAAAITRRTRVFDAVPILQPLNPDQKRHLASISNDVALAPGQILFQQNDPGDSCYVISHGSVDVLLGDDPPDSQRKIATLNPGDFFGEMSALTGQPRSATIRAASPISLIQIEKDDLLEIFRTDPTIMDKISTIVAQRNAQRQLAVQDPAAPAPDSLPATQKSLLTRMKAFFHLTSV